MEKGYFGPILDHFRAHYSQPKAIFKKNFQRNSDGWQLAQYLTQNFQPEMAGFGSKCHTRQKIIHNSVKTYDILMK